MASGTIRPLEKASAASSTEALRLRPKVESSRKGKNSAPTIRIRLAKAAASVRSIAVGPVGLEHRVAAPAADAAAGRRVDLAVQRVAVGAGDQVAADPGRRAAHASGTGRGVGHACHVGRFAAGAKGEHWRIAPPREAYHVDTLTNMT